MEYCKCGKWVTNFDRFKSPDCSGCPECNTTFGLHKPVKQHNIQIRFNEHDEPYEVCIDCTRRMDLKYSFFNKKL